MTSHRNIVCWGNQECGGRMEAFPAVGIVDIISTSGSFAALTDNGDVQSWGASRLCGHPHLRIPPNVELIRATDGAFAALHKKWHSNCMGNPNLGGNITLVQNKLFAIQWITANSRIFFAGRADHVIVYWGFHTEILTPCIDPTGELGHLNDEANPNRKKGWGLKASVVWSERWQPSAGCSCVCFGCLVYHYLCPKWLAMAAMWAMTPGSSGTWPSSLC